MKYFCQPHILAKKSFSPHLIPKTKGHEESLVALEQSKTIMNAIRAEEHNSMWSLGLLLSALETILSRFKRGHKMQHQPIKVIILEYKINFFKFNHLF